MPRQLIVDPSVINYQSLVDQLGSSYTYLLLAQISLGAVAANGCER
jgi:hypothetical protein